MSLDFSFLIRVVFVGFVSFLLARLMIINKDITVIALMLSKVRYSIALSLRHVSLYMSRYYVMVSFKFRELLPRTWILKTDPCYSDISVGSKLLGGSSLLPHKKDVLLFFLLFVIVVMVFGFFTFFQKTFF